MINAFSYPSARLIISVTVIESPTSLQGTYSLACDFTTKLLHEVIQVSSNTLPISLSIFSLTLLSVMLWIICLLITGI